MPPDRPEVLVRKAKQDELILERLLGDHDVDDDAIGFHAQQAAEKLLKAALVVRGVDYPRTHNLGVLIELLSNAGVALPITNWKRSHNAMRPCHLKTMWLSGSGPMFARLWARLPCVCLTIVSMALIAMLFEANRASRATMP